MADIVERLRSSAEQGHDIYAIHCHVEEEAADEIERLRGILRRIIARDDDGPLWDEDYGMAGECCPRQTDELRSVLNEARTALGGK